MIYDVFTRVTQRSHPAVFAAFREIDYDNGAVNRLEPERRYYDVPGPWLRVLGTAQAALAPLTPEQLSTYCCGEFEESGELAARLAIPNAVSELLNAYFNGWDVAV
jgi:hypothetical protein